ncbi:unnamed protein product, partial [Sphacelaria rigidula]
MAAERLDVLTALPSVYEPFTCRPYFFESPLRVPRSLTPAGYALETAVASELLQRGLPGGSEAGEKASKHRRAAIVSELGLQIEAHREGRLRCGSDTSFRHPAATITYPRYTESRENADRNSSESGHSTSSSSPSAAARLTFLSRRADRLVPWPALAWWAATLPGSAARGGVTLFVRLVAFGVRVVLSRAATCVAVDVASFVAASPPGYDGMVLPDAVQGVSNGASGTGTGTSEAEKADSDSRDDSEHDIGFESGTGRRISSRASISSRTASPAPNAGTVGGKRLGYEPRAGQGGGDGGVVVVLLPTHRSYLDFVLVSLLCAAMRSSPGLSWLRVPRVAAAEGPFGKEGSPLRWILEKLGAFFVRRGRGEPDPSLHERLRSLQDPGGERSQDRSRPWRRDEERSSSRVCPPMTSIRNTHPPNSNGSDCQEPGVGRRHDVARTRLGGNIRGTGDWPGPRDADPQQRGVETIEVFVEGTRSRDRRFLSPRTGLLRALQ